MTDIKIFMQSCMQELVHTHALISVVFLLTRQQLCRK